MEFLIAWLGVAVAALTLLCFVGKGVRWLFREIVFPTREFLLDWNGRNGKPSMPERVEILEDNHQKVINALNGDGLGAGIIDLKKGQDAVIIALARHNIDVHLR